MSRMISKFKVFEYITVRIGERQLIKDNREELANMSNIDNLQNALFTHIHNNNIQAIESLLKSKFLLRRASFSEVIQNFDPYYGYYGLRTPPLDSFSYSTFSYYYPIVNLPEFDPYHAQIIGGHQINDIYYEYYDTCSLLEALYFDFNDKFWEILKAVIATENTDICNCFVQSMRELNLPINLFMPLTLKKQDEILAEVQELKNYALKLKSDNVSKGEIANVLADELSNLITSNACHSFLTEQRYSENMQILKSLNFQHDLITMLHSKDNELQGHRGYKQIIGNILTILFSAGILNIINYCTTGNFLFFNQTRTEQLVSGVHSVINGDNPLLRQARRVFC